MLLPKENINFMDEKDKKEVKEYVTFSNGKRMTKKTWIMAGLRRMSYRWPPKNEAERSARVERGLYECATCKGKFRSGEYAIDHIIPLVSVKEGYTTWDEVINNLFCDKEGFQILCHPCHNLKSGLEDSLRASYAAERKEKAKLLKKKK
jgi:5-methylcytosine-specific restriction endonuclease McrA